MTQAPRGLAASGLDPFSFETFRQVNVANYIVLVSTTCAVHISDVNPISAGACPVTRSSFLGVE